MSSKDRKWAREAVSKLVIKALESLASLAAAEAKLEMRRLERMRRAS